MSKPIPVRFVLVNPSHPGNIGAAARAIKTMGFNQLVLINPKEYPSEVANIRASSALDVLEKSIVVSSLAEAVQGCDFVWGTSSRDREVDWAIKTPREAAEEMPALSDTGGLAVVFGCERTGLTNEELQLCHWQIMIPANPDYCSLNLASAVQLIAYELRLKLISGQLVNDAFEKECDKPASQHEMQGYFDHLEQTLIDIDFFRQDKSPKLMTKLRRLYLKSHLTKDELNILRGILKAMQQRG